MSVLLAELQRTFLQDIYNFQTQSAQHLLNGEHSAERIAIYANNTELTLIDLLRGAYPVIDTIVGTDFFNYLVRTYLKQHPLLQSNRHQFGCSLAIFLKTFMPTAQLPYLSDLAQLEWAYHSAFFADDAKPMTFEKLQENIATNNDFNLRLHPSVRIIHVDYNVLDIWQAHQMAPIETIQLYTQSHSIIIWRDIDHELRMQLATPTLQQFMLLSSKSFLNAIQIVDLEEFQSQFAYCITSGVFIDEDVACDS